MDNYYVYAHKHPMSEDIVYIGSGKERRIFSKQRSVDHIIWLEDMLVAHNVKDIMQTMEVFGTKEEAHAYEIKLIAEHKPQFNKHHNPEWTYTDEQKKNMSESAMGKKGTRLGAVTSEETKKKQSKAMKGKVFTEEHIANLSKANKGKPWTDKRRNAQKGGTSHR